MVGLRSKGPVASFYFLCFQRLDNNTVPSSRFPKADGPQLTDLEKLKSWTNIALGLCDKLKTNKNAE